MKKLLILGVLIFSALSASAQFHADIRVGASASSFGDQHLKMGIRAGVGVEYLFSERWGLRSGLFYSMKGATSYLDLPVEALVSFGLSQRTRLELHGGLYAACLLHSAVPDGSGVDIHRWDSGVGFGVDFAVGHFVIGPEVQYGLTRLTKSGNNHNTTYSLTLGYRF